MLASIMLLMAAQSSLNAPLDEKPTVGSEIHRGWEATFSCGTDNAGDSGSFSSCVERAEEKAQQERVNSKPFLAGSACGEATQWSIYLKITDPARVPAYEIK